MTVGEKKKIVVKKMNKKAEYLFVSSSKSKAAVSKKGVITAKKAGTVTVKEKYKKETRKLGKVSVTVRAAKNSQSVQPAPSAAQNTVLQPTPAQPAATKHPDVTQNPQETLKLEDTNQPDVNMEPISQYLEDTNYDAPAGFDRIDGDKNTYV